MMLVLCGCNDLYEYNLMVVLLVVHENNKIYLLFILLFIRFVDGLYHCL